MTADMGIDVERDTETTAAILKSMEFIFPIVILFTISIVGLALNTLIILTTVLSKRLHVPSNMFICSLSVSDFLLCAIPCTFYLYSGLATESVSNGLYCKIASVMINVCILQTLFSFPLIAYNRFVLVVRSRETYFKRYKMRNTFLLILLSWVLAIGVVLLVILLHPLQFIHYPRKLLCVNETSTPVMTIVNLCTLLICFALASRSYIHIYVHLRRSFNRPSSIPTSNQIRSRKAKIRAAKNMFLVTSVFCLSCLPISVLRVADAHAQHIASFWHRVFMILFFSSAMANPMIYAARHTVYRDCIRSVVKCRPPDKVYMDSLRRIAKRTKSARKTTTAGYSISTGSTYINDRSISK